MDAKRRVYSTKWERVNEDLYRLETPEGWLVCTNSKPNGDDVITFVPDKDHQWLILVS